MELGQGFILRQELSQSLNLSLEQRIRLQQQSFSLRMDLVEVLRDERYEPQGDCPRCNRKMTPVEIINGFTQDPNDFTTCCSACGCRFEPKLICFGKASQLEIPFYCGIQTLDKLKGKQDLPPEQIAQQLPGVFRSAIVHYGSLRRAFEALGIEYSFEEISDWRGKVQPFLGRLPDTVIAECIDTSVLTIRAMRRKLGISRYTLGKTLEELE